MDFGRQRAGFLLDGEDPPETVGCRKESCFLELMYVDVAGRMEKPESGTGAGNGNGTGTRT